ncbi:ATP-dependent RNA helicase DHX8/PRP22 [Nematocida sp. AWRm80]|nr:ATP-dependent RNA helicase DHX8/PRP22 [Nematocida sp. AWRm80]
MNYKNVGYSVRFDTQKGKRINYMTDGMLLSEIHRNKDLSNCSLVIVDEVHEKSIESTIIIQYLIRLLKRRIDLYLVIMSASIDCDLIRSIGIFPIIDIPITSYPIKMIYLDTPVVDYIQSALTRVLYLLEKKDGNILVFLTGIEDISICHSLLRQYQLDADILMMHSRISLRKQLESLSGSRLKCILATNIAETSITIPNVKYVIDSGMYKETIYSPETNIKRMTILPVQRPQAEQRAGRTGRTTPGICYRLYTKDSYSSLKDTTNSKVETEPLDRYILHCLSLNIPFPITPSTISTLNRLKAQNIIDSCKMTFLGNKIMSFPISTTASLFLLEALKRNCHREAAIIIAMIEVIPESYLSIHRTLEKRYNKTISLTKTSDHINLLLLYNAAVSIQDKVPFRLDMIHKIVNQLCSLLNTRDTHTNDNQCSSDNTHYLNSPNLHSHIISSLKYSHTLNTSNIVDDKYIDTYTNTKCTISRYSILSQLDQLPSTVVYNEIISITSPNMIIVTQI